MVLYLNDTSSMS